MRVRIDRIPVPLPLVTTTHQGDTYQRDHGYDDLCHYRQLSMVSGNLILMLGVAMPV